jgi:hypothetical protein
MSRVSKRAIPTTPRMCSVPKPCVYRVNGWCDEPRICKGNGDAACHRMNNKDLLPQLTEL